MWGPTRGPMWGPMGVPCGVPCDISKQNMSRKGATLRLLLTVLFTVCIRYSGSKKERDTFTDNKTSLILFYSSIDRSACPPLFALSVCLSNSSVHESDLSIHKSTCLSTCRSNLCVYLAIHVSFSAFWASATPSIYFCSICRSNLSAYLSIYLLVCLHIRFYQ